MSKIATITVTCLVLGVPMARADMTPFEVGFSQRGYERIAQRRGIAVYKHIKSAIIRLGAEGPLPYPPREVQQMLLNYRKQVGSVARLSEARVLKRGRNWLLVYQRLNLPVIDDRDFTLRVTWGKRPNGVHWISYRAVSHLGPGKRRGIVRVTNHSGSWQLKPAANGRTTVARFQVSIDMSGMLPRWMAKSGSGKEVPEVYLAFNRLLLQQRLKSQERMKNRRAACTSNCF